MAAVEDQHRQELAFTFMLSDSPTIHHAKSKDDKENISHQQHPAQH